MVTAIMRELYYIFCPIGYRVACGSPKTLGRRSLWQVAWLNLVDHLWERLFS